MLSIILTLTEPQEKTKFEKIYYKYRNMLFSVAKSIVGNELDAEDILQNTFIKIAKNLDCITDIDSLKTASFLTVILKNTAYDFLRSKKGETFPLEYADNLKTSAQTLEDVVCNSDYALVCKAIRELSSPYNEVLYLHYVYDYSVKKTAALLNRKVSTVKMQLVRGRKILINRLKGEEI